MQANGRAQSEPAGHAWAALCRRLQAWASRTSPTTRGVATLCLVLVVAAWFRVPQIGAGLPFLYDWDEPLNYRRAVSIAQSGDFNPYFFNYPSLDFYLRVPAVAGGFLWAARAGEMRSIQDIVTDYPPPPRSAMARTASHPGVLMWARSVSTLASLLTIAVTWLIATRITPARWTAATAALLVASSPALIQHSARVAPDTLMAFLCLATVWLAWRAMEQPTVGRAALAGLVAGLAVSSKYNALPVVLVPALACLLSHRISSRAVTASLLTPVVGFLAGTPYALLAFPAFLDGVAFELVHYAILGHAQATVEPGWPHAWAFLNWMVRSGGGAALSAFGLAGVGLLLATRWRSGLVLLAFPAGFLLLMLNQRVAFFRNMLVTIPFACILAAWALERLAARVGTTGGSPWIARATAGPVLVAVLAAQPLAQAVRERHETLTMPESRREVSAWLAAAHVRLSDTAIAADLHLPPQDYSAPGTTRAGTAFLTDPVRMFLDGYDRVVVGPNVERLDASRARTEKTFPGERHLATVPRNPEVTIYHLPALLAYAGEVRARVTNDPRFSVAPPGVVRSRVARLLLSNQPPPSREGPLEVVLKIRTPWTSQSCTLELRTWRSRDLCHGLEPGRWERRTATLPSGRLLDKQDAIWVIVGHVHAGDRGRLGIEIESLSFKDPA